ncbi:unnamed protein product [Gadus morhua 'NCC']
MSSREEVGGSMEPSRDLIGLSSEPLSIERVYSSAVSPSCGAVALFIGTTREHFEGRRVIRLEYEAYEPMVKSELSAVCRDIRSRWPMVKHICIQHRLGLVPVAEASVAIAISSPHRCEAQEAVGYCINALKASAPIWKKFMNLKNRSGRKILNVAGLETAEVAGLE